MSTTINHLGEENKKQYQNAVVPPIVQTSNFVFDDVAHMRHCLQNEFTEHTYTRGNNPTVEILRKKLAALDNADDALVFSSGSAAAAAAIFSVVKKGDHIICIEHCYGWAQNLIKDILYNLGVEYTFIDGREVDNFRKAIKDNTKLIYLESPNSVMLELQDIPAVVQLAKANDITTIIDNTYCAPFYQKPL
ncbi:MAG: aminotransferase class V-fold PLP-dependent enzyme, partial [Chitinophagales bacterium]